MVRAESGRPVEDPYHRWLIQTWQTEDGLPENSATAMVQTLDGYLWFGTFAGLVRFDGAQFTVLDRGNTPELPDDGIVNLHLDRAGRLWVSTGRGLVLREPEGWRRIRHADGSDLGMVRTFSERPDGDLLLTLFEGPIYQWSSNRLERLPQPPGRPGRGYLGLADAEGAWWVVQHEFVGRWESGSWRPMLDVRAMSPATIDQVGCVGTQRGEHWILRGQELVRFRGALELERRTLGEQPAGVWSLTEDHAGRLWVASYVEGLREVLPDGQSRRWVAPGVLFHNGVRFVFEDREFNLWVGTSGGGLSRFKASRFDAFGAESGLKDRAASSVSAAQNGNLWVSSFGQGLFLLDPGRRNAARDRIAGQLPRYLHSVLVDRSEGLWVGSFDRGLWKYDQDSFTPIPLDSRSGSNVVALHQDSRGRVWFSGGNGVGVWDAGRLRSFGPEDGLPRGMVRGFGEDGRGTLWVCHPEGVFRRVNDRFEPLVDPGSVDLQHVSCFLPDGTNGLWMGSFKEGLIHWDGERFLRFGEREGLPVSSVHGMIDDLMGAIWLASNRGVVRVPRRELDAVLAGGSGRLNCQLLDRSDGLPGNECSRERQPICARGPDGRLWFATSRGVAGVQPAEYQINAIPPRARIEELTYGVDDAAPADPTGQSSIHHLGPPFDSEIRLPAGSRFIQFRFSAPSFVAPEKVRFQVQLDQAASTWRDIGNQRLAYFESLKPGPHVFRVRACNNDGVWDPEGVSLAFHIEPHFWKTTWFQALIGTAVVAEAGLVVGLVWTQRRRRRAELEVQSQRAELAHLSRVMTVGELASSLAHELNHPQSAILSNAQAGELFLSQNPPALDEVRKIFADIVRDNRRANEIIQRLRAFLKKREFEFEAVDVNQLLKETLVLVEADARARRVSVVLDSPPVPLPPARADRVHLQQVLLNLVLNAMDAVDSMPAVDRRVQLRASLSDPETLQVEVHDSGRGIPEHRIPRVFEPFYTSKPHGMGLGLSLARTLIEAQNGTIRATNHPLGGAKFTFTLPVAESSTPPR